jgi:hypothetical protein
MISKEDVFEILNKLDDTNENFAYAEGTELHNSIQEGRDITKHVMKFVAQVEAKVLERNVWHKAVLNECMKIESCYVENDPEKTLANLIEYYAAESDAVSKDKRLEYKENATHWNQRIEDLMKNTPWPNSRSTAQAMQQLANEMEHAFFNGTYYKKE